MRKLCILPGLATLGLSISIFAQSEQIDTVNRGHGLPDNPSLWRVLMYKAGQTLTKTGDAIQHSAEQTSQRMQNPSTSSETVAEQQTTGQYVQEKAEQARTYTQQKLQQGKEAIVGTPNQGTVPIVQGTLSQPLTHP